MPDTHNAAEQRPMRVAIIAGGLAHERDISLKSGRRVARYLKDEGFEVEVWDLDPTLVERVAQWAPDVVWPLVHGAEGEDGSLQDLFSLLGVPFVGAEGERARIASHKPSAKAVVSGLGICTPDYVTLSQALFRQVGAKPVLDALVASLGLPLVVKPADGGSALGVSVVTDAAELPAAMVHCFAYSSEALVEEFVAGTEVAVSVVDDGAAEGPRVLPLVEITSEGLYDFDARYNAGRAEFFTPARLPQEVVARVEEVARTVHVALGLGELSRVDMIVDAAGTPWVLDINVAPGMTEMSLFPQAAESEGAALYAAIARAAAR